MPTWPAGLPQELPLGGRESEPDMLLRSDMDAGPAKLRRRFSAAPRPFQMELAISDAQRTTLRTFYGTTLLGGALSFDWQALDNDAGAQYRFVEQPAYSLVNSDTYRVSLSLEKLP